MPHSSPSDETRPIRARIQNACDSCKSRKVKCDGKSPCSYCIRRRRSELCHYSPQRKRVPQHARSPFIPTSASSSSALHQPQHQQHDNNGHHHTNHEGVTTPNNNLTPRRTASLSHQQHVVDHHMHTSPAIAPAAAAAAPPQQQQPPPLVATSAAAGGGDGGISAFAVAAAHDDETEVPREARLLVRQLVTSRVDEHAFAPQSSQYSVLENSAPSSSAAFAGTQHGGGGSLGGPEIPLDSIAEAVAVYLAVTAGLVDLFEDARLRDDITLWASGSSPSTDRAGGAAAAASDVATSIVNYLVLAIGYQKDREPLAQACFEYARDRAFAHLSGELSIRTVHAFLLVTLFMLGACQINGAFLFFGLAVRAAYAVGIHRTEVNARFGPEGHVQRDRLWRSLRVVDLFLSTSMGRPPATSDVDCTVPYRVLAAEGSQEESFDISSSSVQIFLILECVVLEVYSRRKITLQLTEGISRQLRDWSGRWLRPLKDVLTATTTTPPPLQKRMMAVVAVEVVKGKKDILLSSNSSLSVHVRCSRRITTPSCWSRAPSSCTRSWLFASSLALGVGLLGSFGRILERYTQKSIAALEHFAQSDAHAMQYSLIAKSLLATALGALEKRELAERLQRAESSSQLFGLMPPVERGSGRSDSAAFRLSSEMRLDGGGGGGGGHSSASAAFANNGAGILGGHHHHHPHHNPHQNHHAAAAAAAASSPGRFVDLDPAFLSLSGGSLPETLDLSFLNSTFSGDEGSGALNLFPSWRRAGTLTWRITFDRLEC
ncbi:hypothetical protein PG994_006656 [Apiospora phragmitis]|uniref:Zn(2)-C6 fungal-type domain-containing protein n=1 Tax=Apiospora phragmitis TaxID=2905665 RepID=A0ABR1VII0_9PEZI